MSDELTVAWRSYGYEVHDLMADKYARPAFTHHLQSRVTDLVFKWLRMMDEEDTLIIICVFGHGAVKKDPKSGRTHLLASKYVGPRLAIAFMY